MVATYIIGHSEATCNSFLPEGGKIMSSRESILFPERLLLALHRHKIKQQDFAKQIGVSPKVISKYIHGRTVPPIDTLYKMADALNVSADWLLGRTDEPAGFYAEGIEGEYMANVKILYRALRDGSEPSKKTLMMLAKNIVKEREEEEKRLLGQRRKEREDQ